MNGFGNFGWVGRVLSGTVSKWPNRFAIDGLDGLVDASRPGAERSIADDVIEEALAPAIAERLGSSLTTDLKPRLIAACAPAAIRVASTAWIAGGTHGSLIPLVDEVLAMLTKGFDT